MRAKKSLGQHFLRSERALTQIIEAGEISPSDILLEIGPGEGALTEKLLETGAKIIAVEKDDALYEYLERKFKNELISKQLTLIHEDILDLEIEKLKIGNYKLIANIPYNITGAIFKKFLEKERPPGRMVLLVQKEVAERIVAKDEKESILSISVKAYGKPKYIETVKAGSFVPAPKVDSAIMVIENISKEFFRKISEKDFFRLLQAGFAAKRKKLSSNLLKIAPKAQIHEAFLKFDLDENIRAENLSIKDWRELSQELLSTQNRG